MLGEEREREREKNKLTIKSYKMASKNSTGYDDMTPNHVN